MLAEILPANAASAEAFADLPDATLPAEEEPAVANAVARRRRAFATGRVCARRALRELGAPPVAIPRGERGAPCWPAGIVGSITHCDGYRAAAVAWERELLCVGIDAEPYGPLPQGVLGRIARPEEQAWLADLAAHDPSVCWDRLLFSAKEAVYKALYPLTGERFEFRDVPIAFDAPGRRFQASLPAPSRDLARARPATLAGRWLAGEGLLLTAIATPR